MMIVLKYYYIVFILYLESIAVHSEEPKSCTDVLHEMINPLKLLVKLSSNDTDQFIVSEHITIMCLSKHSNSRSIIKIYSATTDSTNHTTLSPSLMTNNIIDQGYATGHVGTHVCHEPGIYYIQCTSAWEFPESPVYNKTHILVYSQVQKIHIMAKVDPSLDVSVSSVVSSSMTAVIEDQPSTTILITPTININTIPFLSSSLIKEQFTNAIISNPVKETTVTQSVQPYTVQLACTSTVVRINSALLSASPFNSIALTRPITEDCSSHTTMPYYIIIGTLTGIALFSILINIIVMILLHYYKTSHRYIPRNNNNTNNELLNIEEDYGQKCHPDNSTVNDTGYCNHSFNYDNNDDSNTV